MQVQDVAVLGIRESTDAADLSPRREEFLDAEVRFDAILDLVGELGAADGEQLDAVVGGGVVRCRDHDAEVGAAVGDEERRGRCRHDAGVEDVDAGTREACCDGGSEELAGDPAITGENRDGASALCAALFRTSP